MMRRYHIGIAICALLAASCDNKLPSPPGPDEGGTGKEVRTADMAVSIGFSGTFVPDARVCLVQRDASSGKVSLYFSSKTEAAQNGVNASFEDIVCPQEGTSCYFSAKYPSSSRDNASGSTLYLTLPPEQTPSATAPDPAAMIYAGISRDKFETLPTSLNIELSPLAAYGKVSLTGLNLEEGETLHSVKVSCEGAQLAGSTKYDIISDEAEYDSPGSASSISLRTSSLEISRGALDLHFACKPFTVEAGDTLGLKFETDRRSFSAAYVPDKELRFLAGRTAEFETAVVPATDQEDNPDIIIPDKEYTVTGTIWYISPDGNDKSSGMSSLEPFKTFETVLTKIHPGDQVRIMPGRYETTAWNGNLDLLKEHSGTPGNYISFVAHDPENRPVFHAGGTGVWNAININASYIVIEGVEIVGDNDKISLTDAYNFAKKYYETGSCDWGAAAVYNTNGISIGGTGTKSSIPHHVIIRDCIVHDIPGGGINAIQADYITVEYNLVYNCAWYMMYGGSGISFLCPVYIDDYTGYKMIIRGNTVFNCHTDVPWTRVGSAFDYSDGNGIIVDVNATPDSGGPGKDQGEYTGRTLVENNVSVNNGGSGIHSYKANHVDIVGNTAYHNGWKYNGNYGEIWGHQGRDIRIYNNIMYARPNGPCNLGNGVEYTNNVYYGGQVKIKGTGDLTADPLFVNLSTELDAADFHLTSDSPAIGHGCATMEYLPAFDHDFHSRADRIDCGAYQYIEE